MYNIIPSTKVEVKQKEIKPKIVINVSKINKHISINFDNCFLSSKTKAEFTKHFFILTNYF